MKKRLMIIVSLMILATYTAPVYALDWNMESFWNRWLSTKEVETETEAISAPMITKATYCHKNAAYSGLSNRLTVEWSKVDDADHYEIKMEKADGSVNTYTTTATCLYKKTDCPKMYDESTHVWRTASIQVRAIADGKSGEWSEPKNISCNMIHS